MFRAYIRPTDGHVMLMGTTPETVERDHETTCSNNPGQGEWAYLDIADDALPAREADCDGCGEQHTVRNQWRVVDGALVHDASLRNPHAEIRHLEHAEAHELEKDAPSGARLAEIQALHRPLAHATMAHLHAERPPRWPKAEHVERVTKTALAKLKGSD